MNDDQKPQIRYWQWGAYWADWRKKSSNQPVERRANREEEMRQARMRTRSRIPADHPDIPF